MRLRTRGIIAGRTLLVVSFTCLAWSAGVPTLSLPELIGDSSLIVIGRVNSVRQVSSTKVELFGQELPAKVMEGEIEVDYTIKGHSPGRVATVRFSIPGTPAGGVGYRGIPSGSYRIIFLRSSGGDYDFASPYYSSFPAVPGEEHATGVLDQVVARLADVIQAPQSSETDKLEALFYSRGIKSSALNAALQVGLQSQNKTVQLSIAAAMLERNDISALPVAEGALAQPQPGVPQYLLQNLSSGIARGLRNERAIPTLGRILQQAPSAYARRAAASALRDTGSQLATPPLGWGLKDSDFEVRYLSVIGLAEITGQNEWRPLMEDFREHERKYLAHWSAWMKSSSGLPKAEEQEQRSSSEVHH